MQVDWFTVAAQAINFLILMWLLRRFLYHPVLNAIAAREKYIADQLADAKSKEAEAQKAQAHFMQKNEAFDKQKAQLLRDATREAKTVHDELLHKAKEEVDTLRSKRKAALDQEMHDLMQSTAKHIREEIFATTDKLLRDLADVSLEERMIAVFIKRLRGLSAEDITTFGANKPSQQVHVSSAFTLPDATQTLIAQAITETLHTDRISFTIKEELLSGIELSADGQKLAWSASDYLSTLEDSVKMEPEHAA